MVEAPRGRFAISLPLPRHYPPSPVPSPLSPSWRLRFLSHPLHSSPPPGVLVNSHLPPPSRGTNATGGTVTAPRWRRGRETRWRMKGEDGAGARARRSETGERKRHGSSSQWHARPRQVEESVVRSARESNLQCGALVIPGTCSSSKFRSPSILCAYLQLLVRSRVTYTAVDSRHRGWWRVGGLADCRKERW